MSPLTFDTSCITKEDWRRITKVFFGVFVLLVAGFLFHMYVHPINYERNTPFVFTITEMDILVMLIANLIMVIVILMTGRTYKRK